MKLNRILIAISAIAAMASPAMAHTGVGATHGLVHGFMHPMTGIDHLLAMVGVGLFAGQLGGRAIWAVPASFVGMMVIGGILGMNGIEVPFVETGIALSVLALGAAVAMNLRLPVVVAMGIVGLFAICHGHAHGAEMPEDAGGFAYGIGFVIATSLLHGIGVGLMIAMKRFVGTYSRKIAIVGGSAMALAGFGLLVGFIQA